MIFVNTVLFSFTFSLALFLWGCQSPGSTSETIMRPPETPKQVVAQEPWQQEWEKAMATARKEGSLIVYFPSGPALRIVMGPVLEQKFGIKMEVVTGPGSSLRERLLRERKLGIFLADIYQSGPNAVIDLKPAGVFDVIEPHVILPEVLDPKVWYGGGIRYVDKERFAISALAQPTSILVINLDYTRPEEISSYRDLLNPKFKGKIMMRDPTVTGPGSRFFSVVGSKIMGLDFMRELAKQEPQISRDIRLQLEWLVHGKSLVLIGTDNALMKEFTDAGVSLKVISPSEGIWLSSSSGNIYLINKAHNPNAAKVYINWILTQEGSTLLSRAMGVQSARLDVPTDFLDPTRLRDPQAKYLFVEDEESLFREQESTILARQIFERSLK